jgi:tetratricopeptide (TPR) repeat protein
MDLYDSAIIQLELLTKYFPDDPASFGILAEYLSEIGRNSYAQKVYNDLLSENPSSGLILLSYAEFYMRRNIVDSAFYLYKDAICCSDLGYDEKINLVVNFINNRDFIRKYNSEVLNLLSGFPKDNQDFRIYAAYADIYINNENYAGAAPYLDSALIFEKSNFMLWEQTILVNNYLEMHEDVVRIAKECILHFPDKPNIYFMKALSEYELGNYMETIIDLDTLTRKNPEQPLLMQSYNLAAETYRQLENNIKSDSYYEMILEVEPENLMIRNNYAYYLSVRDENLEKAKTLSYLTVLREPENATYLDTYGWIMFKMNELKEAKTYIEKAIRKGAYNNAEVLDHYGEIMFKLGKCNEAIEAWNKVLELDSSYDINSKLSEARESCR